MDRKSSRSVLDRISSMVGRNNKLGKLLSGYQKLREANYISQHFATYLSPVLAENDALRDEAYRIRHKVYCEELSFEPEREDRLELDEFDAFSLHSLIKHYTSGNYAGTVRIVRPQEEGQQLPIEKYCLSSITDDKLNPANFARHQVCEVSRLAVPKEFRRRQTDQYSGAATGVINQSTYSETELRCFPFIAIGLYFSAAAIIVNKEIDHSYVMMEPRLARSMGFVGIKFKQIGPVVEYHGKRAPYYINPGMLYENLSPSFRVMLKRIEESLERSASM
ncbi:PEP-CTERM/exosortase system-associated acyltransferase [Alteromonas halophila]|nr:PEP-CTERM/exosortase system-associated acyltransferase [Alteromonas halophila]